MAELPALKPNLIDQIDKPILNIVLHLNACSIPTRFSCCGFHYKGEPAGKSHSKNPFIQILEYGCAIQNFFILSDIATQLGWRFSKMGVGLWIIVQDVRDQGWTPDLISGYPIHDYEIPQIALESLEKFVVQRLQKIPGKHVIVDGNEQCRKSVAGWQIEPATNYEIVVPPIST